MEVSPSCVRFGYLLNLWLEERQLGKPSTHARTSSGFILAGQPALMWEYYTKISQALSQTNIKKYAPNLTSVRINCQIAPPQNSPFSATEDNIGKLKRWLLERFAKTAFNKDGVFPAMSGPTAHIHLKEGTVPKARHNPIPVPFNFKEPVRQAIWKDVERGIIVPVPVGMPTENHGLPMLYSHMHIHLHMYAES